MPIYLPSGGALTEAAVLSALGVSELVVKSATVTLTAADLADLHNTPVELVPAPGAGRMIFVHSLDVFANIGLPCAIAGEVNFLPLQYMPSTNGFGSVYISKDMLTDGGITWNSIPCFALITDDYKSNSMVDESVAVFCPGSGSVLVPGAIATSAIAAAGTGYIALETVTRGDATIRIDTVGGGGEVLTYTVTVPGTNNIIGDAQATTGGSGADFTVDIDTIDYSVNPMTLTVKTLYTVMDV